MEVMMDTNTFTELNQQPSYQLKGYCEYPAHTERNLFSTLPTSDELLHWTNRISVDPQLFNKAKENQNPFSKI